MAIDVSQVSSPSVRAVANKPIAGKVSAPNFKFKKSGEFKINGARISVRRGDNLESIVKKINKNHSGVKAELVKGKSGAAVIELKSKRPSIKIDDRKSGIIGDLYQAGQIKRVDKNSRIDYLGKAEIDSSNYLNHLLNGKIKASLADAPSRNPELKAAAPAAEEEEEQQVLIEAPRIQMPIALPTIDPTLSQVPAELILIGEPRVRMAAQTIDPALFDVPLELEIEDTAAMEAEDQVAAEDQATAILIQQALVQQQAALYNAQLQAQAIALHNQQVATCESIATHAVAKVIEEHSLNKTDLTFKQKLTDQITNTIIAKNFNIDFITAKGGVFIKSLATQMSEYRNKFASFYGNDRLEIEQEDIDKIIAWINLH